MIRFKVNGKEQRFDGDPDMPLLWYLRDVAELTGTKFGCGMALCGACTVRVPQCGYCQSGQIMQAIALLKENKNPSDQDIDTAMSGNLCRCGTYQRIRAAIHQAARETT